MVDEEDKKMVDRKMREMRKGLERSFESKEVRVEQNYCARRIEDAEGNHYSQSNLLAVDCTPSRGSTRFGEVEEGERERRPKFKLSDGERSRSAGREGLRSK